ncbi:MAG: hypothetical protein HYV42_01000 [Candidatus Magasanikbacteria bacterium]|nr:hypothetical protein [Candidatus Magasanikbacteria bacterium]
MEKGWEWKEPLPKVQNEELLRRFQRAGRSLYFQVVDPTGVEAQLKIVLKHKLRHGTTWIGELQEVERAVYEDGQFTGRWSITTYQPPQRIFIRPESAGSGLETSFYFL